MNVVIVSTCNLNQWAMDFSGNRARILLSCNEAKAQNSSYRLGPELEVCGYGCEDHFLEQDTFTHCWESLASIVNSGATDALLCDFGMPVLHRSARYNCRVLIFDRQILMIRPKCAMADNGNYRESRYFTAFRPPSPNKMDSFQLPKEYTSAVQNSSENYSNSIKLKTTVPFGVGAIESPDGVRIGSETCEELWAPISPHVNMSLSGVDIIGNGSGSHHELRKLNTRLDLILSATKKCGGVYLYSNQRGCDGSRLYFDGCSLIACNGKVLAQAAQFDVRDVQTISATIDLDDVRSYRASMPSFGNQAAEIASTNPTPFITPAANMKMLLEDIMHSRAKPSPEIEIKIHTAEEECAFGPACWLWDYLRRSKAGGFFLPLSGGADSSSVAAIIGVMCNMVCEESAKNPSGEVAAELRRIVANPAHNLDSLFVPTPQEMANAILYTTYMGTSNSGSATASRAAELANDLGCFHLKVNIDLMVSAILNVFKLATGKVPLFNSQGGSNTEDLALQNIQARLRMVLAYLLAQLLPWSRGRTGFLLVLGSANVDEGLRGYMTKYDCSSADLNPIGAISKLDLKKLLSWAAEKYNYKVLQEIVEAPPTAELRPIEEGEGGSEHTQTDEDDMGMSYEELGHFGRLRKLGRCGPVAMFKKLCFTWKDTMSASLVAEKVKRFFFFYGINRHKMCTITPAYHCEGYSPDDNRFDLRQFLYPSWDWQFGKIDEMVAEVGKSGELKEKKGK